MNSQITLSLELLLKCLSCGGQHDWISLWRLPEVSILLESLPENGTEYVIQHTTAGRGPTVIYFTIRGWLEYVAEEKRKWQCIKDSFSEEHWRRMYPNGDPKLTETKEEVERYRQIREQMLKDDADLRVQHIQKELISIVKVARQKHPLEIELEHLIVTASTSSEFTRLVELKGQLRKMGIHVNQSKTSLRKILKL